MFRIEEVRENNKADLSILSFAAHTAAMALVFIMVVGATGALAAPSKGKSAPGNFRVTATTACTVNYYLSGYYSVTSAILPKTATSHTFTGLNPGNEYGFSIMQRMRREKSSDRPR
jgi:hypothetical protein